MEETNLTISFNGYSDFKERLDGELKANAEGFVRIGYLLKVARDTNVLTESGYKNVAEFAQAEYGLTKDIVSRYIAINDRYSENGYSARLQTQFEGYGVAKLQEMLTLPDTLISEIEPTLTRKEIQDIKAEYTEEQKVTPLEAAMEATEPEVIAEEKELTYRQRILKEWAGANRDAFSNLQSIISQKSRFSDAELVRKVKDNLIDDELKMYVVRVPGIGRVIINMGISRDYITMTNMRDQTKERLEYAEFIEDLRTIFGTTDEEIKERFTKMFGEIEEEPKAAEPKPAPKTEKKVNISTKREEPKKAKKEELKKPEPVQEPEPAPEPEEDTDEENEDFMTKPITEPEQTEEKEEIEEPEAAGQEEEKPIERVVAEEIPKVAPVQQKTEAVKEIFDWEEVEKSVELSDKINELYEIKQANTYGQIPVKTLAKMIELGCVIISLAEEIKKRRETEGGEE